VETGKRGPMSWGEWLAGLGQTGSQGGQDQGPWAANRRAWEEAIRRGVEQVVANPAFLRQFGRLPVVGELLQGLVRGAASAAVDEAVGRLGLVRRAELEALARRVAALEAGRGETAEPPGP